MFLCLGRASSSNSLNIIKYIRKRDIIIDVEARQSLVLCIVGQFSDLPAIIKKKC